MVTVSKLLTVTDALSGIQNRMLLVEVIADASHTPRCVTTPQFACAWRNVVDEKLPTPPEMPPVEMEVNWMDARLYEDAPVMLDSSVDVQLAFDSVLVPPAAVCSDTNHAVGFVMVVLTAATVPPK
mgnify:CR=1 FL=1